MRLAKIIYINYWEDDFKMKNKNITKRLRRAFINMKSICYNTNLPNYKYYGGKGIRICEEWLNDRDKFFEWALNNGYTDDKNIKRKDPNGNYDINNCRCVSKKTKIETKNSKPPVRIVINGVVKKLKELSEESGIPYDAIIQRYHAGWDFNQLTSELLTNETKLITIRGMTHTVTEWAEISGLTRNIILNRMSWGWSNEELIEPKRFEHKKKYIEIDGEIHTIIEWCEILNICHMTFYRRLKNGKFKDAVVYY